MVNKEDKRSHKLSKKSIEDELNKSQYVGRFAFLRRISNKVSVGGEEGNIYGSKMIWK